MITVNKNLPHAYISPNAVLLLCLILMVFFVPMLSVTNHQVAYNFLFSCIFLLSAWSLQDIRRKKIVAVAWLLVIITWIAFKIELSVLFLVSRIGQALFFFLV